MSKSTLAVVAATLLGVAGCLASEEDPIGSPADVVLVSDVNWEQLNPLRRDKSPKAGTLWGDRTGPGPAGFLLRPVDGFRSPPHIHDGAYRGVVIRGLLHNADPNAEDMWMPTGSFWTQPAGHVHITAAQGDDCLAYIEVDDAFGVLPAEKAFDSGEKPVNVDVTNLVWIDPPRQPVTPGGPQVAFVWGNPQDSAASGALVRFPAGTSGTIRSKGASLRAVVIDGSLDLHGSGPEAKQTLDPGSLFSSKGDAVHKVSAGSAKATLLYLRVEGTFDVED
ncbi:MAG: DUF4437 domain-containing protein [Planctomycetota bacterium]